MTALDGDSVILDGTAGGLFADKNVATDKTIDVTGNSLSGDDAGNYNLVQQAGLTADITQADLLVTGLTAGDKTYNANAIAALGGTSAVAAISGDDVTLDGTAGGLFADKNVGSDKTVTASGNTLSGDDAGNYNLVQQAGLTADITQADLLVTGLTAGDKTYNGDSSATLNTANLLLTGLIDGDALSLSATGLFADKNAAADKTVTLASHYTGADVSNYAIVDQTTTTADITQAALTYSATAVSFFSGQAPGELSGGVSGFVAGETLIGSTSGAPTWTTEAGATSQPGSYAINGAGLTAGNYRFVQGAGNASALTLTPGTATNPVVQVTAQLASSVLSPQVRSQPQALNGSSSVRVSQSDNSDNGSADDSSADDANSAALNTQMAIASGGPAMQIVSGGVNLPETMVAE